MKAGKETKRNRLINQSIGLISWLKSITSTKTNQNPSRDLFCARFSYKWNLQKLFFFSFFLFSRGERGVKKPSTTTTTTKKRANFFTCLPSKFNNKQNGGKIFLFFFAYCNIFIVCHSFNIGEKYL